MRIRTVAGLVSLLVMPALARDTARGAEGESRIEQRTFWSEVMQRDVPVHVVLPPGYSAQKEYPSLYFLHGGVYEGFYRDWETNVAALLAPVEIIGIVPAVGSTWLDPFDHPDREVAWDLNDAAVLGWPPGFFSPYSGTASGGGYSASVQVRKYATHFTEELIPFVENNYTVRRDRGGRGITGTSGGALGSSNLVLHRPDLFSFAAFSSGNYDCGNARSRVRDAKNLDAEGFAGSLQEQAGSLAAGKYAVGNRYLKFAQAGCGVLITAHEGGTLVTDEIFVRSIDITEQSDPTLIGDPVRIEFSSGDGTGPQNDPEYAAIESLVRADSLNFDAFLTALGVTHRYLFRAGFGHSEGFFNVFWRDYWVAEAAALFANPEPVERWNYKTIERDFKVWGYRFHVKRGNTEFLTFRDFGVGGFIARGTGGLTIESTPRLYQPNGLYRVTTTAPNGTTSTQAVPATGEGRLGPFTVHLGPARVLDQHSLLEEAGLFDFEDYRVSIEADPNATGDDQVTCTGHWVYPVLPCR